MKTRFVRTFLSVIQLSALNSAIHALEIDDYPFSGVQTGQTYTILYHPNTSALVDFSLLKGPAQSLSYFRLLGSAQDGVFKWNVSHDLPDGKDYALKINKDAEVNYSGQFGITRVSNGSSTTMSTASPPLTSSTSTLGGEPPRGTHQGGLNKAAKAGIGVGSAVAGFFLLLAAFLYGRRVHKTSIRSVNTESDHSWTKPELEGKGKYQHEYIAELDGNAGLQEMRTDADAKELVSPLTHERAELCAESKLLEIDDSKFVEQSDEDSQRDSQGNEHGSPNTEGALNGTGEVAQVAGSFEAEKA
ncbi:hypothetical protein GQ44DRAFT_764942 [Phaeosphaeriaceae sp. PMI808]|nr:hypothetical protein GQ44DRAFT_764942 [Phaeosphaeriaceae sp. PMI808]